MESTSPQKTSLSREPLLVSNAEATVRRGDMEEMIPPLGEEQMSNSVLYMSMSLDGYIAGPDDRPGNPGGDRFMRLHEWYGFQESNVGGTGWGAHFMTESQATGAV